MFSAITNRTAVASLTMSRFFGASNWNSIPAVFFLVASDLQVQVSGLGLISSAFLVGAGLFQIVGGLVSGKLGLKKTCLLGTTLSAASLVACALSPELLIMTVARFIGGVGLALYFAPAVSLTTRYFRSGSEGFGIGLSNMVASLGGAATLFLLPFVGESIGWRISLVALGCLGLLISSVIVLKVPGDIPRASFVVKRAELRDALLNRWMMLISVEMLGISIGSNLTGTFMIVYLHDQLGLQAAAAGGISSLVTLMGLLSAPLAGRLFDAIGNVRLLMVGSGALVAVGVALASIPSIWMALAACILTGFGSGAGFTIGYSAARTSGTLSAEYQTIAISWVNGVQIAGGFWAPIVFSDVAIGYGYPLAWLTGAAYTLVLVLPILFAKGSGRRAAPDDAA